MTYNRLYHAYKRRHNTWVTTWDYMIIPAFTDVMDTINSREDGICSVVNGNDCMQHRLLIHKQRTCYCYYGDIEAVYMTINSFNRILIAGYKVQCNITIRQNKGPYEFKEQQPVYSYLKDCNELNISCTWNNVLKSSLSLKTL